MLSLNIRVTVRCVTKDAFFKQAFYSEPSEMRRTGFVSQVDDAQIILVLDKSLNDAPDNMEKKKAEHYGIPATRVLRIPFTKIDNLVFAQVKEDSSLSVPSSPRSEPSTPLSSERAGVDSRAVSQMVDEGARVSDATMGVRCNLCRKVVSRISGFYVCDEHFSCFEHMCPWDKVCHRPLWEDKKMTEFAQYYFSVASREGRLDKFTEIRFLFKYRDLDAARGNERLEVVRSNFDSGYLRCQECFKTTKKTNMKSIGDYYKEFYKFATEDPTAARFISNAYRAADLRAAKESPKIVVSDNADEDYATPPESPVARPDRTVDSLDLLPSAVRNLLRSGGYSDDEVRGVLAGKSQQ
jgi:hypothetical protein